MDVNETEREQGAAEAEQKPLFTKRQIYRNLLVLAIPIALQNFLSALLNIVDSTMVQSLGEVQMGAVLLVNQFIFVFQVIIFAIAGAGVVFISQFWGKGSPEKIAVCTGFCLVLTLGVAALFTALSVAIPEQLLSTFFAPDSQAVLHEGARFLKMVAWSFLPFGIASALSICLRGIKVVVISLIVSAGVVLCNFFFNYTFMFGKLGFPKLDIVGAAVGTVIARCIEMLVMIAFVAIKKYPLFASPKKMLAFTKPFLKEFFRVFLPACANEIFWVVGTSIYLRIFSHLPDSESILAAVNISQAVDKLVFVALIGVGNAAGIVVGYEIGAKNNERARQISKQALLFSTFVGLGITAVMGVLIFLIPSLYRNINAESIRHAQYLIAIFAVFMPVRARSFALIVGILRSGGDTIFCMLCETVTVWAIAVPVAFITGEVFKLPIEIIYLCIYVEEVIKMIIVTLRFRSGKWMRNLVKDMA